MKRESFAAFFPLATNTHRFACYTIAFSLVAIGTGVVHGDVIVVTKAMSATTIAEVFVEDDSVRLVFEIELNDIEAFKKSTPRRDL